MITLKTAKRIAAELHADVDIHQFRRGLIVELEHRNVTHGRYLTTGKIALAHLKERPDYYTGLEGVEGRPKGAPSLKDQEQSIKDAARSLHLEIKVDRRVTPTPYRAQNPRAAELLGQECPAHEIILDPEAAQPTLRHPNPEHLKVVDERHEVVEFVVIGKLKKEHVPRQKRYKIAHRIANKLQSKPGAERIVYGKARLSR